MPAGSRRTRWLARSRAPVRPCGFLWLFATIAAAAPPVAVPSATVAPTGQGSIINLSLIGSAPAVPAASAAAAPVVPNASGTLSHGNFTLGAGEDYDVQVPLSDVPANPVQLWDGKSLTLGAANAGFLVLSASNTHTGTTTVNGGTLAITGWTGNNASG
ncbi:MAG: autotransporter-associated beta strand repeat-containing protein, partial [Opitutaceae bacterium]|nr:autotransporter-associated beta strand repeat-containing protein [Opitutaceae bacterium]